MGVTNNKLVQVQPPEGGGDGHVLANCSPTPNVNGVGQTSTPSDSLSTSHIIPFHIDENPHRFKGHTVRVNKQTSLQGSMGPIHEIPNQKARVRKSLIAEHAAFDMHNNVMDHQNNEGDGSNIEQNVSDTANEASDEIEKEANDNDEPITQPTITKALYDGQLNVKQAEDSARCDITGCVVFGEDKIAIADNWNGNIKLFMLTKRSFISSIQLEVKPWDITAISCDQLAVTCNTTLAIIDTEEENGHLNLNRYIPVQGKSRGVAYHNENFIITFVQPEPCVRIIKQDGRVLKVILKDSTGLQLFKRPEYVTVNVKHDLFYVSDFQTNVVTCLNKDGKVCSVYTAEDLKKPTGVVIDNTDNVLVAGWGSENIHRITKDCDQIQIVLLSRDIITYPQAIAFNKGSMYMSHYHFTSINNYLSVYELTNLQQPIDSYPHTSIAI